MAALQTWLICRKNSRLLKGSSQESCSAHLPANPGPSPRRELGKRQDPGKSNLCCFLIGFPATSPITNPFSTLPRRPEHVISGLKRVSSNSSKPQVLSRVSGVHHGLAPAKRFSSMSFFYLDFSQCLPLSRQPLHKAQCAQNLSLCSSVCPTCPSPLCPWQPLHMPP